MFESIFDDIKNYFRSGNMISRLIIINSAMFLAIIFVKIGLLSTGDNYGPNLALFTKYISLNSDFVFNLKHPWVFITHAFTHFTLYHFAFNMLFLYWFGRILGDLLGDDRIVPIYILGIIGGIIFISIYSALSTSTGPAYGASAAVWAIIIAVGFTAPDYSMHLILIGPVRLKYIIGFLIVANLLAFSNMQNMGGQLAHLGGGVMGGLFIAGLRNGTDLSIPINNSLDKITALFDQSERSQARKKSPLKVSYKSDSRKTKANQSSDNATIQQSGAEKLDEILDKIKDKGISSLSKEEKQYLDQQSKKD